MLTSASFRREFKGLPSDVQEQAREAYRWFLEDPFSPTVRFKQVHASQPVFSPRVNRAYRALGGRGGDEVVWFWIVSHTAYEQILRSL